MAPGQAATNQSYLPKKTELPKKTWIRSQSGQFVIHPTPALATTPFEGSRIAGALAISCERIKQLLWRELGDPGPWRGQIHIALARASEPNQQVIIQGERFRDGWRYRLEIPEEIEPARYVRTIVQVLLVETANRSSGERSAEVPAWLIEGLTEQLLASSGVAIMLPPPRNDVRAVSFASTNVTAQRRPPLEQAHVALIAGQPLTFDQLSWPGETDFESKAFRSSAHLFVQQLIKLKGGREGLQNMLRQLPQHYNWQFAFFRGFQDHFTTNAEVEKWWALRVVHFTGRDLAQTWPLEQSWKKLNEIVHASVQVRVDTNDLPIYTEVALQNLLLQWDHESRKQTFETKVRELQMIRIRVAEPLLPLTDGYRAALENYLQQTDGGGSRRSKKKTEQRALEETINLLNELDGNLLAVRPDEKPITVKTLETSP